MAQVQQSVVSAEADQRSAMDAMQMAVAAAQRVKDAAAREMTDSNWWTWQERMRAADRAADKAAARVVEASKAVCRAWAMAA